MLGHTAKFCPEEKQEATDRASVKCFNCEMVSAGYFFPLTDISTGDEVGHRVRDCKSKMYIFRS